MNDEPRLTEFLKLFLVLMVLAIVHALLSPSIPNLVAVRGGLFDHCTIQFAVWRGNLLNEIPPAGVPYVYVDYCCQSHCL